MRALSLESRDVAVPEIVKHHAVLVPALTSPLSSIAIILVLFLLVAKSAKQSRLVAADYTLIAAVILDAGLLAVSLVAINPPAGDLVAQMPHLQSMKLLQLVYAWGILYPIAKGATEIAFLFMLRDVFGLKNRRWKYIWLAVLALTVATGVVAAVVSAAQCQPVDSFWNFDSDGRCLDRGNTYDGTVGAMGGTSAIIVALAFFEIIFADATKKHKALLLFYWIFGFLLVVLLFPSLLTYNLNVPGFEYTDTVTVMFITAVGEVSIGSAFVSLIGIIRTFCVAGAEKRRQADTTETLPTTRRVKCW